MFLPEGSVRLIEQRIEYHDVGYETNLLYAAPAVHTWLIALGCTVVYEFKQKPE